MEAFLSNGEARQSKRHGKKEKKDKREQCVFSLTLCVAAVPVAGEVGDWFMDVGQGWQCWVMLASVRHAPALPAGAQAEAEDVNVDVEMPFEFEQPFDTEEDEEGA
ncbi:hypothetical protein NLJ89_g8700 [Agrocybe chaxingu]|uniref:Uncharacterized protein n=1 Tax=Agrocybe chaxingu TaxID=84603 RepID=A0A9W8JUD8_9AGAR|nr:hypothetical protein NLJ89_g8700 [Agrocybe chaxingu]